MIHKLLIELDMHEYESLIPLIADRLGLADECVDEWTECEKILKREIGTVFTDRVYDFCKELIEVVVEVDTESQEIKLVGFNDPSAQPQPI